MSAFVVGKAHIDALVAVAIEGPADRGPRYPGDGWYGPSWQDAAGAWQGRARSDHADAIGNMLTDENVASVSHRYPDDTLDTLPGPEDRYYIDGYQWARPWRKPTTVEALSLIACLEYQSCEHPGWETSRAYRFLNGLRVCLVSALPGYSDAPWEWPATAAEDDARRAMSVR